MLKKNLSWNYYSQCLNLFTNGMQKIQKDILIFLSHHWLSIIQLWPNIVSYLEHSKINYWTLYMKYIPWLILIFLKILFIYVCMYVCIYLFIYLFLERGEGREKEKRNVDGLPLATPISPMGTWPTTQACAMTGNQAGDLLFHSPALSPLSHTSQGICSLVSMKLHSYRSFAYFLFPLIWLLSSMLATRPWHSWVHNFNFLSYLRLKTQIKNLTNACCWSQKLSNKLWMAEDEFIILILKNDTKYYWVKYNKIIFMC